MYGLQSLGAIYSMPGGLKKNIEYYLGQQLRVDQCEGQHIVYQKLAELAREKKEHLPKVFDVLNCSDGCNFGTGCDNQSTLYEANHIMNQIQNQAIRNNRKSILARMTRLFQKFDHHLSLKDFMRNYLPEPVTTVEIGECDLESAFEKLGKNTYEERNLNCSGCGSQSCLGMAKKIALGINIPENCIIKAKTKTLSR